MSDTTQTNAMAEIALALAMGFFSIMVLTMVSMGSGMVAQESQASAIDKTPISIAKSKDKSEPQESAATSKSVEADDLVIFHNGQFYDHQLKVLNLSDISLRPKVVLAVNPDLPMSQTLSAREQIKSENITVVILNERWLNAIKEAKL